jgi:hypothetical protein
MHCQPFTTKEAVFKAGVILIACKVWAKRGIAVCLFNMGGVGSKLFFDQVDYQLSYTTFNRKGPHISNYAVWRFMEDGKEADSVQRQIIRRTLSIKMTDIGIWRHFFQCVTRSFDEQMIPLKIPKLYLALANSSKAPFVRNDIKLLTSQEWAVIEKDVRSENGRRGNQGAVCSVTNQMELETGEMPTLKAATFELGSRAIQGAVRSVANQMELETGEMPTLKAAAFELGSRGKQGAVCSVANQMELKTGVMPTLKEAAYELGSTSGRKCV